MRVSTVLVGAPRPATDAAPRESDKACIRARDCGARPPAPALLTHATHPPDTESGWRDAVEVRHRRALRHKTQGERRLHPSNDADVSCGRGRLPQLPASHLSTRMACSRMVAGEVGVGSERLVATRKAEETAEICVPTQISRFLLLMAAPRPLSAAAVEADVLTLIDSLSSLVRAIRVPEDGARPPPPRPGDPPPPPTLAPAVAERLAGAAASLADAAAELKRRAVLADAAGHCATVRAARARTDGATESVSAGLAALADEAAEMMQVRKRGRDRVELAFFVRR